jgi:hypothetical protein
MKYRVAQQFERDFALLGREQRHYCQFALRLFKEGELNLRTDPIVTRSSSEVWCVPFGPHHVFTYSFEVGGSGDMLAGGELICVLRSIGERHD